MLAAGNEMLYEMAALAAALLWCLSALAWSFAGRRVGSVPVAVIRIVLAAVLLCATHWIVRGQPWPTRVDDENLWVLVASGIMGACVGDLFYFRTLALVGPRIGSLLLSLSPILTALLERLSPNAAPLGLADAAGIVMTVAGVAWVVLERQQPAGAWAATPRAFRLGIILGLISSVCTAGGFVLSRMGMAAGPRVFSSGPDLAGVDSFSATVIRVAAAAGVSVLLLPALRSTRGTLAALRNRRAMGIILAGTLVGPTVGIWMSMVAFRGISTAGVAATLINTSPILIIPILYFAFGHKPTLRTLAGTLLAVAGVAVLMLWQG